MTVWRDFTSRCLDAGILGLSIAPADVGRYLEHLVETEGKTMATARMRLVAIAAGAPLGRTPGSDVAAAGRGR